MNFLVVKRCLAGKIFWRCLDFKKGLKSVSLFNEELVDAAKALWSRADHTLYHQDGGYLGWLCVVTGND
jgi:hypothetical protein